jgi:amidase
LFEPMLSDHYAFLPAVSLAAMIREGKITSAQLTELFIGRIETLDRLINAVVVRCFDDARLRAAALDADLANGTGVCGPLHGVPITVKENNDVAGLPSTLGNPAKIGNIAERNSPAIQKLLDAGAIIIGKTNCALDLNDVQT